MIAARVNPQIITQAVYASQKTDIPTGILAPASKTPPVEIKVVSALCGEMYTSCGYVCLSFTSIIHNKFPNLKRTSALTLTLITYLTDKISFTKVILWTI